MLGAVVIFAVVGCSLRASAQPAACESDQHCQSGFYCMPDAFLCGRCLNCEDFKRDLPRVPTACIRSVTECGSCIKGYVDDLRGDGTVECVAGTGASAGGGALPVWAWVAVSLGLLLFVLVVVTVLYVLRNKNTFKILASTRTSVRSPGMVASAPEAPPPYRAHYHNHNNHYNQRNHHDHDTDTDHTDHYDTDHYDTDHYDTDTCAARDHRDLLPDVHDPSAPCDEGSPPASPRAAHKPRPPRPGPREAAARQETQFFSEPYYVRPPRYSDAGVSSPASPPPEPPSLHDEDTMESTWTAGTQDDNGNAASGGELAELLAAARLHHQHHLPCTQDSNNNRSSGAAPAGSDPSGSSSAGSIPCAPHAPVSYIINVVQNMQNRTAVVIFAVVGCSLRASAQPAACESDQHCQSGFYCMPDAFLCGRCLNCEDFKRDLPRVPTACIRSVTECGSCIKGYVDDLRGDGTVECVAGTGASAGGGALPVWAWVAVSLGLLLFVLVVVTVLYVLRNKNTFKILASTRTSVRSPGMVASAPEAPPPYRAHYHNHNNHYNQRNHHDHDTDTDHTDHYDTDHYDTDHYDTDTCAARDHRDLLPDVHDPSAPCDEGSPPASPRAAHKPRPPRPGPREAAARQETQFFSEPYYVRPPRYSDAGVSSPASPPPEPPSLHDEDTMESTWTAGTQDDNGNAASGGELAELLAAARLHHQHHLPCTQDSNNNRSSGAAPAGSDPSGSSSAGSIPCAPHAPVSYIINVVQNMQNRT